MNLAESYGRQELVDTNDEGSLGDRVVESFDVTLHSRSDHLVTYFPKSRTKKTKLKITRSGLKFTDVDESNTELLYWRFDQLGTIEYDFGKSRVKFTGSMQIENVSVREEHQVVVSLQQFQRFRLRLKDHFRELQQFEKITNLPMINEIDSTGSRRRSQSSSAAQQNNNLTHGMDIPEASLQRARQFETNTLCLINSCKQPEVWHRFCKKHGMMIRNLLFRERPEKNTKYLTSGKNEKGTSVPGCTGRKKLALQHIHEGRIVFWVYCAQGIPSLGGKNIALPPGRYGFGLMPSKINLYDVSKDFGAKKINYCKCEITYGMIISWGFNQTNFVLKVQDAEDEGKEHTLVFETAEPFAIEHTLSRQIQNFLWASGKTNDTKFERKQHVRYGISCANGDYGKEACEIFYEEQQKEMRARRQSVVNGPDSKVTPHRRVKLPSNALSQERPAGKNWQWEMIHSHQGSLHKKGGLAKTWIQRHAVLYNTSQGYFMMYYNKEQDIPLYSGGKPKYRQMIDMSLVTSITSPSEIDASAPGYSFDISTPFRSWTFSASTRTACLAWIQKIVHAVGQDSYTVPDVRFTYLALCLKDTTSTLALQDSIALQFTPLALLVVKPEDDDKERDRVTSENCKLLYEFFYSEISTWSLDRNGQMATLWLRVDLSSLGRKVETFRFSSTEMFEVERLLMLFAMKTKQCIDYISDNASRSLTEKAAEENASGSGSDLLSFDAPITSSTSNNNGAGVANENTFTASFDVFADASANQTVGTVPQKSSDPFAEFVSSNSTASTASSSSQYISTDSIFDMFDKAPLVTMADPRSRTTRVTRTGSAFAVPDYTINSGEQNRRGSTVAPPPPKQKDFVNPLHSQQNSTNSSSSEDLLSF
eukprot:g4239.t1